MKELHARRLQTEERFQVLKNSLSRAETIANGKACVYVTGSFGRGEASKYSDLDLFILGKNDATDTGKRRSQLKRLDDICIKAELIHATRELKFPEFSGDGKFLVHYNVQDLTKELGSQEDDFKNTFTARLLLLLESRPIVGSEAYQTCVREVVDAYWRDWDGHAEEFIPAFLANDILRLWRTFCVNYEARTLRMPSDEKAKGKLRNYKLKHSRMLTCYSALLFLLTRFLCNNETVSKDDALEMISQTPTERIENMLKVKQIGRAHDDMRKLLEQYNAFLANSDAPESDLIQTFSQKEEAEKYYKDATAFGDTIFRIMRAVGQNSKLYRLTVV